MLSTKVFRLQHHRVLIKHADADEDCFGRFGGDLYRHSMCFYGKDR